MTPPASDTVAGAPHGGGADALDPLSAPWGAFRPTDSLMRLRSLALRDWRPYFVKRWAYKLFTHVTKKRGLIVDLEYIGGRFRLFIDENGQDRWVFRRGRHPEEEELELFSAPQLANGVFIDIGANNGYFAVSAAHRMGPNARIFSFEPHPRTFNKLLLNLSFNDAPTVTPLNLALGPEESVMALRASSTADGCNTLATPKDGDAGEDAGVEVRVAPLVDQLRAHGVAQVDVLKIDVEGFEDEVLFPFFETAPETLWPKRMIMERTNQETLWRRDCLKMAVDRGYRVERETMDNAWLARPGASFVTT